MSAIGVCTGLIAALEQDAANVLFTGTVFAFGVAYFYSSEVMVWFERQHTVLERSDKARAEEMVERLADPASALLACVSAVCGGFLTATIGTGADIALYAFGIFGLLLRAFPFANASRIVCDTSPRAGLWATQHRRENERPSHNRNS